MIYLVLTGFICVIDQVVKYYVDCTKRYGEDTEICKGKIILTKQYNKGAFLNFGEKHESAVTLIAAVLFGGLLGFFSSKLCKRGHGFLKVAISMIAGGALSNLIDRICYGHVIDYLNFKALKKVVMNIADLFIFLGSFFTMLYYLFHKRG